MIVQSFGQLQALTTPAPAWTSSSGGSLSLYGLNQAYAEIYRSQPNVRICVDFLARNIAQLGLPVYRRVSDTDRERLNDHDLARWLSHPNPATTRYRLIEDLMTDLGIYFRAYWLKVRYRASDGRDAIGLVRLPPEETRAEPEGALIPKFFRWTVAGRDKDFQPSEIVHFSGYRLGISPLETLRRILSEEAAASEHREQYWRNASRAEGIWELAKDAPDWKQPQQQQFREQWQEFAGGGSKAGMTAVGPRGATYKEISFSAKDSEYIQGGKLRREVCAAQYHIPQPLVGILDHATFSNVKEQHKHLYADTLGPWNEQIVQEIERQLLIECEDQRDVYTEFNIDAKLAGTPEERASSLQMAVGRPWRTVNEARALENLPRIDDPEFDTVAPQQGGPAEQARRDLDPVPPVDEDETAEAMADVIQATQARQRAKLSKVPEEERAEAFFYDVSRWNRELAADLEPLLGPEAAAKMANETNLRTLTQLFQENDA